MKEKGILNMDNAKEIDHEIDDIPCLVYFNPNSGTEIAIGFNDVVPDVKNPFYNTGHEKEDELDLIYSPYISGDLAKYLLDNYKFEGLCFGNEPENRNILLNNFDFLSRFYKGSEYAPEMNITLV
jgi:hypothetical protein